MGVILLGVCVFSRAGGCYCLSDSGGVQVGVILLAGTRVCVFSRTGGSAARFQVEVTLLEVHRLPMIIARQWPQGCRPLLS